MTRKTMRSPRRIDPSHPALQAVAVSESEPAEDSFSWKLWLAAQDIAKEALATTYMQGIANGNLDPNDYGQYTIQDAAYCYAAQNDYKHVVARAKHEGESDVAAFAEARYHGYVSYTKQTFVAWNLKDPAALAPGPAAQTYIDVEHGVSQAALPVYFILAMIPCEQLWPWLATQLQAKAIPTNVYSFWITENNSWSGAYRLDNFIDRWFAEHPGLLDEKSALAIYRACMTCELNFFRSATGQPLVPMPQLPSF